MITYIIRRLFLIIPTLLGIMLINFLVIQAAPGGPVEKVISQIKGTDIEATAKFAGTSKGDTTSNKTQGAGQRISEKYKGSRGLDPELIETIEKQFGSKNEL